jgi:hypothetical protein
MFVSKDHQFIQFVDERPGDPHRRSSCILARSPKENIYIQHDEVEHPQTPNSLGLLEARVSALPHTQYTLTVM